MILWFNNLNRQATGGQARRGCFNNSFAYACALNNSNTFTVIAVAYRHCVVLLVRQVGVVCSPDHTGAADAELNDLICLGAKHTVGVSHRSRNIGNIIPVVNNF